MGSIEDGKIKTIKVTSKGTSYTSNPSVIALPQGWIGPKKFLNSLLNMFLQIFTPQGIAMLSAFIGIDLSTKFLLKKFSNTISKGFSEDLLEYI